MVPGQGLSNPVSSLNIENETTTSMVDVERDEIQRAETIESIRGREFRNEYTDGNGPFADAG